MSGEFKSTSEFYAQESEFADQYKKGLMKEFTASGQHQGKMQASELSNNDDFGNISSTI